MSKLGGFDEMTALEEAANVHEELHRLRALVVRLRTALLASQACAMLEEGGACDGCYASRAAAKVLR